MTQTKIRPVVEGGVLSAVAIVFALISAYMPLLGPFVNLIWPVPIILLGVRHGYKWSLLATAVSGILIAMLMHPLQAISVVVGFGLIGIVLGHAIRSGFSPAKTLLWGSVASFVSTVAVLAIGAAVTGINPLNLQTEAMTQAVEQAVAVYRGMGIKEEDLAAMSANMQTLVDLMKIILPAGFVLAAVVITYLNFIVAKAVLKKLGVTLPDFPAFKEWKLPRAIAYFFALGMVGIYWGKSREITLLYNIAVNVQVLTSTLLFVQGLAIFYFIADKYNLSKFFRGIILILLLTNGFLSQGLIVAGALDMVFDYRRLRRPEGD